MSIVLKRLSNTKKYRRGDYKRFSFVSNPAKDGAFESEIFKRGIEIERQLKTIAKASKTVPRLQK
jgi:hypothetical protein